MVANVDATLVVVVVVIMIMIVVVVMVMVVRMVGHAVMTIPALAPRAVAVLVDDAATDETKTEQTDQQLHGPSVARCPRTAAVPRAHFTL